MNKTAIIISITIIFMPVRIIGSMYFTSMEMSYKSLIIAASRGLVLTVIGLNIFPVVWAENGIWITPAFSEGVTALLVGMLVLKTK